MTTTTIEQFREQCLEIVRRYCDTWCAPNVIADINDLPLPVMPSQDAEVMPEQAEPVAYINEDTLEWMKEIGAKLHTKMQLTFSTYPFQKNTLPLFAQDPSALLARIAELEAENQKLKELSATDELLQIGKLLRTQDNRCTDQPLWIVQQKRIIIGIDTIWNDGDDHIVWLIEDYEIYKGDEEFAELEKDYQEDGTVPQDYTRTAFHETWEFVTACLTEDGCQQYINKNGHNLKEPRIYADGSYRNAEYRAVRDWLISLPEPVSKPE